MTVCCVENCGLTTDDHVILFEFPTSRLLRRRWLEAIKPPSRLSDDARVCIKHFTRSDYEEVRGKTRLKGRVVPSLFGDQSTSKENEKEDNSSKEDSGSNKDTDNEHESDHDQESNNKNRKKKKEKSLKKRRSDSNRQNKEKDRSKSDNLDKSSTDSHNHNETTNNHDEKSQNHNEKTDNHKENSDNHKEKSNNHSEKSDSDNDNEKPDNDVDNNEKGNNKRSNSSGNVEKPLKRAALPNGHRSLSSSDSCTSSQRNAKSPVAVADDIEELLTNYHIENKKTERQLAAMAEEFFAMQAENAPVFIEMEVGQGNQETPSNDCLMLLENVQVDVDPALLLHDDDHDDHVDLLDDHDDHHVQPTPLNNHKKQEAISLLTSSDSDEVIIEEPHIDTVEVSDETDEDDVPLVKLKPKAEKKPNKKERKSKKKQALDKILWGGSDYYCVQCRYSSASRADYRRHLDTHSKVIQICQDCGFTTCSKSQLYRHRRKHKNEKKHKCPLCNYSARHNMSLIYHLKTHENIEKEVFSCDNCDFVTPVKSVLVNHRQTCVFAKTGRYPCDLCDYMSKRRSDLKRHLKTVHKDVDSTDDET